MEALDAAPQKGISARQVSYALEALTFEEKVRVLFSSLSLRSLRRSLLVATFVQTRVRLTRIACALELFRLKNGSYPESLEMLVPEFLSVLPSDLITLQPMHYRREDSGHFLLWSVGWNGVDDGGEADEEHEKGDWVWRD